MLFKLSNLNSNLALTLGYLYQALNNSAQSGVSLSTPFQLSEEKQKKIIYANFYRSQTSLSPIFSEGKGASVDSLFDR